MPLYEYRCPAGHRREVLAKVGLSTSKCPCGEMALRVVSPVAHQIARRWGSDFRVTREMRGALDEASGYKAEALQAKEEAIANGFRRER